VGNQADLEVADLIEELAAHDRTRVIGAYVEDVRDGRALALAALKAREAGNRELGAIAALARCS